ncbi:hypothetical protein EDB19DRAFT_1955247 [Suillus lakei]|nr:hypothetical protein EDB19DRAFT_1955247 [Suillus lakei]
MGLNHAMCFEGSSESNVPLRLDHGHRSSFNISHLKDASAKSSLHEKSDCACILTSFTARLSNSSRAMVWFASEHFAGQTVNAPLSLAVLLIHAILLLALGAQITDSHFTCTARMDALPFPENQVKLQNSEVQGVALLTLYAKGFARPPGVSDEDHLSKSLTVLIDRLPCARVTSALGILLLRAQHLFLFLHAPSLLPSAVHLNTIGPYSSQ